MSITNRLLLFAALLFALASPAAAAQPTALKRAKSALDAVDAARCIEGPPLANGRIRVALVIYPDGAWAPAVSAPEPLGAVHPVKWPQVRACIEQQLVAALGDRLDGPPATPTALSRELRLDTEGPLVDVGKIDGSIGAICRIGTWRTSGFPPPRYPTPKPCRRGLQCCSGGPAGSDSHCMAVANGLCPPLP